jgi:hypothetical protein
MIEDLQNTINELKTDLEYFQDKCDVLEDQVVQQEEFNWMKLTFEDGSFIIVAQNKDDDCTPEYLNERYAYGHPLKNVKFIGTFHSMHETKCHSDQAVLSHDE